jgi:hypothetical protein
MRYTKLETHNDKDDIIHRIQKQEANELSFQEKHYDPSSDRLFLVYYALDSSVNQNGWRVSPESLDRNIKSFIGKPIVLKQKDPYNLEDMPQTGKFVHPILKNASLDENLQYQEQFSVGRINDVYRNYKGWRFDVEITNPYIKEVLKSGADNTYPKYVSPQIATFPDRFPGEPETNIQNWQGLHLAFVDVPAYGFAKSDMAGKCYGSEQLCTAQLQSAASAKPTEDPQARKMFELEKQKVAQELSETYAAEQKKKEYENAMKLLRQEQAQAKQERYEAEKLANARRKYRMEDDLAVRDKILSGR